MEELGKKVSYLRGLFDGLEISLESKEGKMLNAIVEVLDEVSDEIHTIRNLQIELDEYITLVDDGLAELEDDFYQYDSDDDESDFFDENEDDDDENISFEKEVF